MKREIAVKPGLVSRHLSRVARQVSPCPLRVARTALFALPLIFTTPAVHLLADEIDLGKLPPTASRPVDYDRDIKPVFEAACFRCHGPEKPKSKFRLDNRESALKGGKINTNNIVEGNSAESVLIHYVAGLVEDMEMPPLGKGDRLTPEQIGLLRAWIDQGAKWPAEAVRPVRETKFTITPTVRYIRVTGDNRKFREDWWQKEGFSAGYERFELSQPVGAEGEFHVQGRAMFDQQDYRVALELRQPDLGFVRAGYDTYRKYYDDTGGYYRPYNLPPTSLERDLYVDIGKAWFDVGLTLPDLPRVVFGYEYQFKEGDKSTLQWGQISNDPTAVFGKAIRPSVKAIDEQAHIVKLDADYALAGLLLEDSFRAEFYDLKTDRLNKGDFDTDTIARHNESYHHFQAANSFRAEKQLRDWLLVSGGYLYTRLDGDGAFSQTFSSLSAAFPTFIGDASDRIALEQDSHTVNVNTMLGPWKGLTLSAGIQSEWLRREGLTDWMVSPFLADASSKMDKWTLEEDVAVRYNTIPFTVLYAEGRFQQERIDHFERAFVDDGNGDSRDFVRDTDATGDLRRYRIGFTISPAARVSLESSYTRREKTSDYDHLTDSDGAQPPGKGYPAFILSRAVTGDEVEAKLVLRLLPWLKTSLKYQLVMTDYKTRTDSLTNSSFLVPGGEILAGNEDSHVYSAGVVITPWRRLYWSTTVSYNDSRIISGVNNDTIIAPYKGDVFSVLTSANVTLNAATALRATYSFSRADYRQNNEVDGLPLGIRYDRHGLIAGLTRKFKPNLSGSVQYGLFRYREPTAAGANDYTAHAVMASLSLNIP